MIQNLNEFKEAINIYEVISNFVSLKKNGINWSGCCPFHDEKTPSFVVSESKGIFHCFGCEEGGDSISFIQKYKNLNFEEACIEIAQIIGFELVFANTTYKKIDFSIMEKAKDFFKSQLNMEAKEYFLKRGLNQESIDKWDLGFCPSGFVLNKIIEDKDKELALNLGLINKSTDGRIYTPFSNRLIFPIYNIKNKIAGFGGRIIEGNGAKYINSKESKQYVKKQILYGLNLAKENIIRSKEALILEGYMDCILAHQVGFNNTIATCGTALSYDHIAQLTKLGAKIILCFDNDNAGLNATFRASENLIKAGVYEAEVLLLETKHKDFAEIIANGEIETIKNASRVPIIEFMLRNIIKPTSNIEQKNLMIIEVKKFLLSIKNDFIKESYIKFASQILNISPKYLSTTEPKKIKKRTYNLTEASIIKAISLDLKLVNQVIEWLYFDDFITLKECFSNLASGIIDSTAREIMLDESIILPDNLSKSMLVVYESSAKNKINNIKNSSLPIIQKIEKISQIKERLEKWSN